MIIGYIIGIFIVACVFLLAMALYLYIGLRGRRPYEDERAYHIRRAMYLFVITFIILIVGVAMGFYKWPIPSALFATWLGLTMRSAISNFFAFLTIIFCKVIQEGDRLKIAKDSNTYVGKLVKTSMFHLVLLEEITPDTYLKGDGKAGRLIHVPNHYIFTGLLVKYGYQKNEVIWDSLEFLLAFKSDYERAVEIAKEIIVRYSDKEAAKRQYQEMRPEYALQKDIKTDPRVFIMPEKDGAHLYVFYIANIVDPNKTLEVRSEISIAIMKKLEEEGIFMANANRK
ncbi:mechanosensitive ion channel family protein [Helicobacter suis]|uniref:mechanosensitive ion channel domain-containing protein n=1 Tax=Helicobacter suis TaxID=104628 RepID=UPI0002D25C8B|nr:mechanosensitive ion channel domain-containing protein [Helicobacter suis]